MKPTLVAVAIALFTSTTPSLAAPGGNGGKPTDASFSVDLPAQFWNPTSCVVPINVTVTGHAKTINLPGNRIIITAPKQQAVITNLEDSEKTVSFNITGVSHQKTDANGNVITVATGRNLMGDPVAGLVLAIGNFSFIFDSSGTLIQPLMGQGQQIDVCKLIE
jgi:hypothetical protein